MINVVRGQDGLPVYTSQSSDPRVDAVLKQYFDSAKVEILGQNMTEQQMMQQIDAARPKLEQLFRLSDGMDRAQTDAEKATALKNMMSFVNANGGNPIAMYPYLAKEENGYTDDILAKAGFTPTQIAQIGSVAQHQRTITPVTQADMDKLTDEQKAQVADLQKVIEDLRARIEELQAQQRAQVAQAAGETSGVDTGPNTRPTEGLAPAVGETAPAGTVTAQDLALQANVPVRA